MIPYTERQARAWLMRFDGEAKEFWSQHPVDGSANLIGAYWNNVLDFGPEPDYTLQEKLEYDRRHFARFDKSWEERETETPEPDGLKTYRVMAKQVGYEYYSVQALSEDDAVIRFNSNPKRGFLLERCQSDGPEAIEAELMRRT